MPFPVPQTQPDEPRTSSLATIAGLLVAGDAARDFHTGADLTYRSFTDVQVKSADLKRSMLYGTLFQSCVFTEVEFDNCDIEGARFAQCTFVDCTFVDADLRSCTFAACNFKGSRFDQALLLDITVQGCDFHGTFFDRASIHDSTFEQSTLRKCSIKNVSALHNTFDRTGLEDIRIADCTFLYALMLNCRFDRVELNVEAVGTIYGISRKDLASMTLVFLGKTQRDPDEDLIEVLKDSYQERKWYFLKAMLEVCYGPEHRLFALNRALDILCEVATLSIGVKRDEFRFLLRVAEELSMQGLLPIGFLVHAAEQTGLLLSKPGLTSNVLATVQELHNRVYLLLQQSVDLYNEAVGRLSLTDDQDAAARVTLTYRERPTTDAAEVIRLAGQLMPTRHPDAILVSARSGSWIEVIQTSVLGAMTLYAIIAVTNGILAQLIRTRALANALVQPIPKRTVQTLVKSSVFRHSEPAQSRLICTALNALSNLTSRSAGTDDVYALVAGGLEKLEAVSV
ncbi:MAG: pentapeptide repeat-containing protein, partial [Candidatus Accumulibacter sp.]|nr:pentapeptide repeat-containing protein [Accumulibacter sp.]